MYSGANARRLTDRLDLAPDALPAAGNWYPEEDVLHLLLDLVEECAPRESVICGAGLATAVLARAGRGRVSVLESDERVRVMTQALLQAVGAEANVIRAELVEYDKHNLWYAPWSVRALPEAIDLLFIDGPGHFAGRTPRWPAGPELFGRLSPGAVVLLDDGRRVKEKKALKLWAEAFPDLVQYKTKRSGGAMLLCRKGAKPACIS